MFTKRNPLRIMSAAVALTALGVLVPTAASASAAPAPTAASSAAGATATSLSQAETLASPSVVLIQYTVSATAQNVQTGDIFNSFDDDGGPLTTSFIGTGFFVSSDGFIVTAAHLAAPTSDATKQAILTELYTEAIESGNCGQCGADPAQDAASVASRYSLSNVRTHISVFTQNLNLTSGATGLTGALVSSSPATENDTAVIKVDGSNFPVLPLGDSSAAQVGDPVAIIGYPSTAISNVDLSTVTSPTITSGSITNKPQQGGFDRVQTDATAEHGNSGGPVINAKGEVIGIVSNGPTSTTNFLIPSNAVNAVARQAAVNTSSGQIDELWRTGLTAFDAHHYRDAAAAFSQCVALNPIQVGCVKYNTMATENFAQDVPVNPSNTNKAATTTTTAAVSHKSSGSSLWLIVALVVGGLAVLALGGLVIGMRRRGNQPAGYQVPGSTQPFPVTYGEQWGAQQQWAPQPPAQQPEWAHAGAGDPRTTSLYGQQQYYGPNR